MVHILKSKDIRVKIFGVCVQVMLIVCCYVDLNFKAWYIIKYLTTIRTPFMMDQQILLTETLPQHLQNEMINVINTIKFYYLNSQLISKVFHEFNASQNFVIFHTEN
ncbi:hypothetical protein RF11_10193 [Thelohanellus kitauei]|uniref:Uncharacterized protein n=1 Tax=Thelohanellus kitauei TaxID=669202 RepID=A0A0C2N6W3_THEKT|nr:hypothetical protein RF11_10193 [Thelohanellus kitauei]